MFAHETARAEAAAVLPGSLQALLQRVSGLLFDELSAGYVPTVRFHTGARRLVVTWTQSSRHLVNSSWPAAAGPTDSAKRKSSYGSSKQARRKQRSAEHHARIEAAKLDVSSSTEAASETESIVAVHAVAQALDTEANPDITATSASLVAAANAEARKAHNNRKAEAKRAKKWTASQTEEAAPHSWEQHAKEETTRMGNMKLRLRNKDIALEEQPHLRMGTTVADWITVPSKKTGHNHNTNVVTIESPPPHAHPNQQSNPWWQLMEEQKAEEEAREEDTEVPTTTAPIRKTVMCEGKLVHATIWH